jgi:hypothetical protein
VDPKRLNELTERIEAASERAVDFLGRIESRLADATAIEGTVVPTDTEHTALPVTGPVRTHHVVVHHDAQRWYRVAGVAAAAFLFGMLVRRMFRSR